MSVFPSSRSAIPPSLPQSAFLNQNQAQNTWYEILDYTMSGGFLHEVRLGGGTSVVMGADPEFRLTVDGEDVTIADTGSQQLDFISTSNGVSWILPFNVRFSSSLKVEVRKTTSSNVTLNSRVLYSTDI